MSPAGTDSRLNRDAAAPFGDLKSSFATYYESDLFWAPFRTASRMLLESHRNMAAIAEIHRKLTDEYLDIARRQHDLMHETLEKLLHEMADGDGPPTGVGTLTSNSFTELYENAVAGFSEFSRAVTDAQARSLEALRKNTQEVAEMSARTERKTAA